MNKSAINSSRNVLIGVAWYTNNTKIFSCWHFNSTLTGSPSESLSRLLWYQILYAAAFLNSELFDN